MFKFIKVFGLSLFLIVIACLFNDLTNRSIQSFLIICALLSYTSYSILSFDRYNKDTVTLLLQMRVVLDICIYIYLIIALI
jgi:hypothetical protein